MRLQGWAGELTEYDVAEWDPLNVTLGMASCLRPAGEMKCIQTLVSNPCTKLNQHGVFFGRLTRRITNRPHPLSHGT